MQRTDGSSRAAHKAPHSGCPAQSPQPNLCCERQASRRSRLPFPPAPRPSPLSPTRSLFARSQSTDHGWQTRMAQSSPAATRHQRSGRLGEVRSHPWAGQQTGLNRPRAAPNQPSRDLCRCLRVQRPGVAGQDRCRDLHRPWKHRLRLGTYTDLPCDAAHTCCKASPHRT